MSTVTAILEPQADGTLHVPLPYELRQGKIRVVATLESLPEEPEAVDVYARFRGFGALKGKIWISPDFDEPMEDFKEYME